MPSSKPFDRYDYYTRAVQSPEVDCRFLAQAFRELRGKAPRVMREDFCGTFKLACEWVRRNSANRAIGIDLDREPLNYGRENYLSKLKSDQQKRLHIVQGSVINARVPKADIVAAFNFSFYIFKTRKLLLNYFRNARRGLKPKGLFMVDCFGGGDCQEPNEESSKISGFTYYWDQESFDPITQEGMFHIHIKRKGERRREKVFSYDWRLWSIPEIRDAMMEAGFKKTHVYWEGYNKAGYGDGNFKRKEQGEPCDGWVAYVVGEV